MKPSIVITTALLLNTLLLFGQGFDLIIYVLPIWALSAMQTALIFLFLINRVFIIITKATRINLGNIYDYDKDVQTLGSTDPY